MSSDSDDSDSEENNGFTSDLDGGAGTVVSPRQSSESHMLQHLPMRAVQCV